MEQSDMLLLQTVPPYHLQAMVKARYAARLLAGRTPEAQIDAARLSLTEVAEYLFASRACRDLLRTLEGMQVRVLRELVNCGGRANSRDLALYFSALEMQPGSVASAPPEKPLLAHQFSEHAPQGTQLASSIYPVPHPHGPFELALHHLLVLGLLFWGKQTNFVGRDYANGVYDGVLIVPQTVLEAALEEWQLDEPLTLQPQPDELPGDGIYTFQRSLYLYWSLVAAQRDGLPLVSSHLLTRSALRQVIEHLAPLGRFLRGLSLEQVHTESEAPQLLFLRQLLLKMGLLVERQGALHAMPAGDFFSLPLVERAWRCFHLWLESSFWNELAFLPDVIIRPGPSPLDAAHEEAISARETVVEQVWQTPQESWYPVTAFVARMKLHATYLLFPRHYGSRAERYSVGSNPYGWDFRLRRGWLTHREGWHMVEGGFVRSLLAGPLFWLGAVELEGDGPNSFFRLAQGAAFLASETPPDLADVPGGRLVVQPNFDLVALAPVTEGLLVELDHFAERVRLEHIAQYHLSKASITRAVQLGMTVEHIQQILMRASGTALPQNVQYSLQEWERQARKIEVWPAATLLEVADPAQLDELMANAESKTWLARRLSPTLAEVRQRHLEDLREWLWQRDFLPALASAARHQDLLQGAPLPTREAQWKLRPDGLLCPCYALPNLYLAAELAQITDQDEETGWRKITRSSLGRALQTGVALEQIVRFLENYCLDGVPGSFLIRLKLWGQGYSVSPRLQVEQQPLLSLSAEALQDLLADEEIGPLLGEPVPAEQRLIHVSPQHLERVIDLLKERGFTVN
jgi:hypothetical protein